MKIYVIVKNNCESSEDFYEWMVCAYTTHNRAVQHLLNEGFEKLPWGTDQFAYKKLDENGVVREYAAEIVELILIDDEKNT